MSKLKYQIIRARRKSISLSIEKDNSLLVRAPFGVSKKEIDKFVQSKRDWVEKKWSLRSKFEYNHPKNTVSYLGKNYKIVIDETKEDVLLENENIIASSYCRITEWLYFEAARVLDERMKKYVKIMNVYPSRVKLSNAGSKWGSCSGKKSINLSWRLIFCPLSVIDYVVVHELSHIIYMDHSALFWAKVGEILPNYKEERKWLKLNNGLLEKS